MNENENENEPGAECEECDCVMIEREYLVTWSITVDAETAEDAAMQAHAIATDPASAATIYVVEDCDTGARFYYDTETNPATLIRSEAGNE